jgi:methionyl-tRNA formyltransferase
MKVCVFGNKSTTSAVLRHLTSHHAKPHSLVTLSKENMSQLEISGIDRDIASQAESLGIHVYGTASYGLKSTYDQDFFSKEAFDLGICTGWQRLIPQEILNTFRLGVFGWHGSGFNLPNGRGRSPLNWTIRLGMHEVFHNCFKYAEGADTGEIYNTLRFTVNKDDYIADVLEKAKAHIQDSALSLIRDAANGSIPLSQQANYPAVQFPALNEASGRIYPSIMQGADVINIIRSCSFPFPGSYLYDQNRNTKIRIWKAEINEGIKDLRIGYARMVGKVLLVRCRDAVISSNDFKFESTKIDKVADSIDFLCG